MPGLINRLLIASISCCAAYIMCMVLASVSTIYSHNKPLMALMGAVSCIMIIAAFIFIVAKLKDKDGN